MRFYRTPAILPLIYPSLIWRMPADEEKSVYLTFDDGPVPGPTEFVLHTLKSFQVKGTFFCIGDNVRKHPEIFMRIAHEGHSIGNHTFNHLNGWKTDTQQYVENTRRFDETARQVMPGFKTSLFRPPYGRITRSQLRRLPDYQVVMWDVLSYDFDRSITPGSCLHNTLKAVRNGSIVVFHDSHKALARLEFVLPRFVDKLLSEGFSFKSIAI
jgi:peptidoglycan/xylan/chitin deacetylase (PgdA/CDA1 family)